MKKMYLIPQEEVFEINAKSMMAQSNQVKGFRQFGKSDKFDESVDDASSSSVSSSTPWDSQW